jgi:hypothetical protein
MRLTLRTLLAWLDDTLQPAQVRAIGKQVSESAFAQELSDRIHRVTRQRRLSVPGSSGPDGSDPNVVASYLDNDLDADAVADYEKRCLTSDVHLAEVASVHQILSLLGQKVKVPAEARARMYHLVKGREALVPRRAQRKNEHPREPVTKPIAAWVVPELPRRSWIERNWQLAAALILLAVASLSAWKGLSPQPASTSDVPVKPAAPRDRGTGRNALQDGPGIAEARGAEEPVSKPDSTALAVHETAPASGEHEASKAPEPGADRKEPGSRSAGSENAAAAPSASGSTAATKSEESVPLPAGAAGVADTADGVFLRYDTDQREWTRLSGATPLGSSDRLLCLTPFREPINLGKTRVTLVGQTEIRLLSRPGDEIPALELVYGRVLVRQPQACSLNVGFAGRTLTLAIDPDSSIGVERLNRPSFRQDGTRGFPLAVSCSKGKALLSLDKQNETLTSSIVAIVETDGPIRRTAADSLPTWLVEPGPSPGEVKLKEQFLTLFHPDRPVLTDMVSAIEDERSDMKSLAVAGIEAWGDLSLLAPVLSRKDDPLARRFAIGAMRDHMARSGESIKEMHEPLVREFGTNQTATLVEKMLVGYSSNEASKPELLKQLVGLLSPEQESVGVRELALDTLRRLTGREDLGYSADNPEGKGLAVWKNLLSRGELKVRATPPAPK